MSEVEALRQEVANIAEGLLGQVALLTQAQEAQKGAYVLLLKHLSAQGCADLETLQQDLEMLADVQADASLQDEYVVIAGAVQNLRDLSSGAPRWHAPQ